MEERPYTDEEAIDQAEKVCASGTLAMSQQNLLRHVVGLALDPATDSSMFSGYAISQDLFKSKVDDPTMGKTIGFQLRNRLKAYYASEGRNDPILIEIPRGTFKPIFSLNAERFESMPQGAEDLYGWALQSIAIGTGEALWNAGAYLAKGLEVAPGHPKLLTKFLFAMWELAVQGRSTVKTVPLIQSCLAQCKGKSIHSWEALYVEACLIGLCEWQWEKALDVAKQANRRSNGRVRFRPFYRALQLACGQFGEAIDTYRSILHDSPHSDQFNYNDVTALANIHDFMGDHGQAEKLLRELLRVSPTPAAYDALAMHLSWVGRYDAALSLLQEAPFDTKDEILRAARLFVEGFMGNHTEARKRLAEAQAYESNNTEEPGMFSNAETPMVMVIALLSIPANEFDLAVESIERALVRERHPSALLFPPNMAMPFRALHNHDGFRNLIQRLHLPLAPKH